ncbi:MAG: hypothetical protein M1832_001851 [Thelocarpon impressellum]|nr:MAG: hypothetical protein M1832_001851 [Thelocarpon impressellum]
MSRFYRLLGADTPFDPTHRFVTSWLLPPWVLFGFRALISLYAFVVLFFIIGYNTARGNSEDVRRSFSFFTILTYWGLAFYFLFAAIHTSTYARTGSALLSRWPRPLQALHSIYYTSIITLPFLVTLVFWVILYDGPWFPATFDAWRNVSEHAMNAGFAFFELAIPRTSPPPLLHLLFLIIILALYLGLAYVTYAAQGFYTYSFLDPQESGRARVVAYVFGILAAIVVVYLLVRLLVWLRVLLTERILGMQGKFHGGRSKHQGDVEMSYR